MTKEEQDGGGVDDYVGDWRAIVLRSPTHARSELRTECMY